MVNMVVLTRGASRLDNRHVHFVKYHMLIFTFTTDLVRLLFRIKVRIGFGLELKLGLWLERPCLQ